MEKKIINSLKYISTCILDVIYGSEDTCVICGGYSDKGVLCSKCSKEVKYFGFEGLIKYEGREQKYFSPVNYSSIVKEMIVRLKYKSDFETGKFLAGLMKRLVLEKNIAFDIITFVPIDKKGKRRRGYNQSEFLAKVLSESLDKKVIPCLKKARTTKDQIGLNAEMRWNNLKNSFIVTDLEAIKGKRILLVDDVVTTGATAFNCSMALLGSGCSEVTILTAAKSNV